MNTVSSILSEGSSISVQGSSIWPGYKSVRFYSADGSHCNSSQSSSNYSVSIPGRLAGQKPASPPVNQGQRVHSQIDFFTRSNNQSREIGTNSIPEFHIHRDGIYNSRQYCPSSLGQSTMYSRPNRLVSETSCCLSKNVSLFTGETECFCSICRFRQTAPSPSSDGSFRSVETACSSTRTQNICYRTDKTSSGMVVGQGQIITRSCSQTTSSSAHSLYRCELFGLGCSSGTGRTHVSWSLASEPISSTHQHPRNEGYSSSSQRVPSNSSVMIATDNSSVVAYLQKEGGTHSPTLCVEVWETLLWCQETGISLRVRHIPGRTNILADRLSRSDKPISTEWSLNQSICNSIFLMSGHPNIDLFATRLNNRLPLFVSPIPDSKALAIDAMSMNWDGIHAYAFPPFHIIPAILTKIRMHRCKIVLIAPLWPQRTWFPELLHLSIAAPIFLPVIPGFLTQKTGTGNSVLVHQNPQSLSLLAWILSNDQSQIKIFRETLQSTFLKQEDLPLERFTRQNGASFPVGVVQEKLLLARHLFQM